MEAVECGYRRELCGGVQTRAVWGWTLNGAGWPACGTVDRRGWTGVWNRGQEQVDRRVESWTGASGQACGIVDRRKWTGVWSRGQAQLDRRVEFEHAFDW